MRFARFIAERLDKRGTQSDLAKELNISRSTITAWRQGAKPAFEICLQLAERFDLPPGEIFSMVGDDSYRHIYTRFLEKKGAASKGAPKGSEAGAKKSAQLSQEHYELHNKLQVVMESQSEEAEAIATMIDMAHRQLSRREGRGSLSVRDKIKSVYQRQKGENARVIRQKLHKKEKRAEAGGLGTGPISQES